MGLSLSDLQLRETIESTTTSAPKAEQKMLCGDGWVKDILCLVRIFLCSAVLANLYFQYSLIEQERTS